MNSRNPVPHRIAINCSDVGQLTPVEISKHCARAAVLWGIWCRTPGSPRSQSRPVVSGSPKIAITCALCGFAVAHATADMMPLGVCSPPPSPWSIGPVPRIRGGHTGLRFAPPLFSELTQVNFLAINRDVRRRLNSDSDLAVIKAEYGDPNVATNNESFPRAPCEDKHDSFLCSIGMQKTSDCRPHWHGGAVQLESSCRLLRPDNRGAADANTGGGRAYALAAWWLWVANMGLHRSLGLWQSADGSSRASCNPIGRSPLSREEIGAGASSTYTVS